MENNNKILSMYDYEDNFCSKPSQRLRGGTGYRSHYLDSFSFSNKKENTVKFFFPINGMFLFCGSKEGSNTILIDDSEAPYYIGSKYAPIGMQQVFCEEGQIDMDNLYDNPQTPISILQSDGSAKVYQLSIKEGFFGVWNVEPQYVKNILYHNLNKRIEEGLVLEQEIPCYNFTENVTIFGRDEKIVMAILKEDKTNSPENNIIRYRTKQTLAKFEI